MKRTSVISIGATISTLFAALVCLTVVSSQSQASVIKVTFDDPLYVAGQLPPSPWWQEYDYTAHYVGAGVGYEGSQGLVVPDNQWAGITYDFPTPLSSDMGEVSISTMFKPGGGENTSTYYYMAFGGMQVGRGEKKYDTATYRGMIFRKVNKINGIYGPGGGYGTYMSGFTTEQWYELTYELNASWDTMTLSVGPVGGTQISMTTGWDGGDITRVWVMGTDSGNAPIYDNLDAVPEPSSLGLFTLGGLAMFRRRRA